MPQYKKLGDLKAIRDHGQIPPFLNPIKECWSKIMDEVRKTSLGKNEILTDRMSRLESSFVKYFLKRLNMERI